MNGWDEENIIENLPGLNQGNDFQYGWKYMDWTVTSYIGMQEYYNKKRIDLMYQQVKKSDDIAYKQMLMENQYLHGQRVKEGKLAHCEVVKINEKGEIQIVSKKMTIPVEPRLVANFKCKDITMYIGLESEEKIVQLLLEIENDIEKKEFVFLDMKKIAKSGYIERKFSGVGAEVYASSAAKKKEYTRMIVTKFICRCTQTVVVPNKKGWYRNADNIDFFDGQWTWEELVKNAK